jgi:hypothetical protein
MPVYVNYKGRTGNKLFQYVSARIFSEKNELNLRTKFPDIDVLNTKEEKFFTEDSDENNLITVNSSSFFNDEIIFNGNNKKYLFDDYFQNCIYINNNQELVISFFDLPKFDKNTEDIVLNIRLDDKVHSNNLENPENWDRAEIIHPNYYKKILDSETYKNVYIVVDKIKYDWEKKYMSHFEKYNPILVSGTPFEDFNFIRTFNKIITSVSTFSYWSAFLSDADKIYTFKNAGYLGKNMSSHGNHVKELWNVKNKSIVIDEKLYFGE